MYSEEVVRRLLATAATAVHVALREPRSTVRVWLREEAQKQLDTEKGPLPEPEARQVRWLLAWLDALIGFDPPPQPVIRPSTSATSDGVSGCSPGATST